MLRLTPTNQGYALYKAASARKKALAAANVEEREHWLAMEAKWQEIADTGGLTESSDRPSVANSPPE
jgi:hypothetical protein